MVELTCIVCNKKYKVDNYRKETSKFCSYKCYYKHKRNFKEHKMKKCKNCNKEFVEKTYDKKRVFCSQQCYFDFLHKRKNKKIKICPTCNKEFVDYDNENRIYCSRKCKPRIIKHYKLITKECEICHKTFLTINIRQKTCSRKCGAILNIENKHKKNFIKGKTKKRCKNCGKEFEVFAYRKNSSNYCSNKCKYDFRSMIKVCNTCGKIFKVELNLQDKIFYCSKDCNHNRFLKSKSIPELELFSELSKYYKNIDNDTRIDIGNEKIYPDIIINNNIVIEFFGDYYHCNPDIYDKNFLNKSNKKTAKDIWEKDKKRLDLLKNNNYIVYVIWEQDYKNNKKTVINNLKKEIYEICKN